MTDAPRDRERLDAMIANPRSRVYRDEDDGSPFVLLNDLFVPAADAEEIPEAEIPVVLAAWERRGWWGVLDWVIQRRYVRVGGEPHGLGAPCEHKRRQFSPPSGPDNHGTTHCRDCGERL